MKTTHSEKLIHASEYPLPSHEIIRRLSAAIEKTEDPEGTGLDQKKIGELMGIPKGTFNEWLCHDMKRQPIKRFLSGIERLSEPDRIIFIRALCRPCPRLEDPRISHDEKAAAVIKALIQRDPAITLITGSDPDRTYLLTAIGNSFAAHHSMAGFDVHRPVDFVPVPGVLYPSTRVSPKELPALFQKVWPRIAKLQDSVVLLNGIWTEIRSHLPRVRDVAMKNHLLIADDFSPADPIFNTTNLNLIHVESFQVKSGMPQYRIRVEVC